jgi:hypothetical protein
MEHKNDRSLADDSNTIEMRGLAPTSRQKLLMSAGTLIAESGRIPKLLRFLATHCS